MPSVHALHQPARPPAEGLAKEPLTSAESKRPRLTLVEVPSWGDSVREQPEQAIRGQGLLDLAFMLPNGLPAVPEVSKALLSPAPRRWPQSEQTLQMQPTDRSALPPVGPWAARLAQAILEVCTAGRPVSQLARWTDAATFKGLEQRYEPRARRTAARRRVRVAEQVRSVHVCEPADGVAEVSVVIAGGERPRALALRLEGWRGRWICTTLDWV